MKYLATSLIALAFTTAAVQAHAAAPPPGQNAAPPASADAAPPPAAPAPDAAAPPAATPAPAAGATAPAGAKVSDQEIDHFAQATVQLQKITADATLDATAKQQKMAAVVKATGLDPKRYNEIGHQLATDTDLRTKVQMAMAKYAGPNQG